MPSARVISAMYGPGYEQATDFSRVLNPKQPHLVLKWLKGLGTGTFLDYGCGTGGLLLAAMELNWRAVGVEFDPEVARRVQEQVGAPVISVSELLQRSSEFSADVLHLGDVIEHLPDLDDQFPQILGLIKPGGLLLAQGPLEAGPTLFTTMLRLTRFIRPSRRVEGAPFHVLLATVAGQRQLFQRFELEEMEYSVHEVAWPAPMKLSFTDLGRPRLVAMFATSAVSRKVSRLAPSRFGNRYFYAGRYHNPSRQ